MWQLWWTIKQEARAVIYGYIREGRDNTRESQEKIISSYASDNLSGTFCDEEIFGAMNIFERPSGEELFDLLKDGDTIVATKLDRCFVSIENAVDTIRDLLERNIYFNILETGVDMSTESGQMIFETIQVYSDFNRRIRGKLTADALGKIRGKNRPVNKHSPIGYKIIRSDGEAAFIPDYKERETVATIIKWKDIEGVTWSEVVRRLAGQKRANGIKWHQANVRVAYHAGHDGFPEAGEQQDAFAILEKDRKTSRKNRRRQ